MMPVCTEFPFTRCANKARFPRSKYSATRDDDCLFNETEFHVRQQESGELHLPVNWLQRLDGLLKIWEVNESRVQQMVTTTNVRNIVFGYSFCTAE